MFGLGWWPFWILFTLICICLGGISYLVSKKWKTFVASLIILGILVLSTGVYTIYDDFIKVEEESSVWEMIP